MPEYLAPGVYVEEVSFGAKPIEGVSTSTAAFLGATERGPESPRLMTSWLGFQRSYGGYVPDLSYLPYAVQGFFDNGGQRCFVGRIVAEGSGLSTGAFGTLAVWTIGRGAWGDRVRVRITDASSAVAGTPTADWFKVTILYYANPVPEPLVDPTDPDELANPDRRDPDALEMYDDLTFTPGDANNVETVVNASSQLVRMLWTDTPERPPVAPDFVPLAGGSDPGPPDFDDFEGSTERIIAADEDELLGRGRGLAQMAKIDEISLLVTPDEVRNGLGNNLRNAVINQCEQLRDRFALISADRGQTDIANLRPHRDTTYAAFYYPWISVFDPSDSRTRLIPPVGHVAGIVARTDIERGVHKAPANEVVRGALDLETKVVKQDQDLLNPRGVNCIRDFTPDGRGIRLWGARTMASDKEWKYVNVRRLFLYIEESIDEGTQWVVFEPNDEPTWAAVRRSITNFLIRVWRSGALMGATEDEAFFVKCDRTTMTQDDIDNGRLICYIGIAPVKPAEFVIFRIGQKTADAPT
jgi:phage tail sheath protein FI